jgi:hypothetical protein
MEDGNNTYSYDGYEFDRYARHKTSSGSRNDPYLNIWDKDKDLADIAKDMFIFVGKKE